MNRLDALNTIVTQVGQGELAFPTSAEVALRVQRALDNPDCHIDTAAKLVQAEPVLAARVVAIANSAVYNRAGREISDVKVAVTRLGFRTVRSLATAMVTRQMSGASPDPAQQKLAGQLWEHTAHVAALAHTLARQVTHTDPETALFAGIVHEVGSFYLLSRAKDYPSLLDPVAADPDEEAAEIAIGRAVLKALGIPAPVAAGIEAMWEGFLAMPPTSLGDTLLLANELAPVASPFTPPPPQGQEAGKPSLDMVVGEDTLTAILSESASEVESLTGALRF